jgi:hypothetical protein
MVIITAEHIEQLKTPAGGYNMRSMEMLGMWPLRAGWQERMIGRKVGDRRWKAALREAAKGKIHRFRGNTR